jgi:hypothetical protein
MIIENDANALSGNLKKAIYGKLMVAGTVATMGAVAIPLAGFSATGIIGGSLAAWIQSTFYGAATCGVFSVLQSAGATLAWVPVASGGTAAVTAGAVGNHIEANNNTSNNKASARLAWVPVAAGGTATVTAGAFGNRIEANNHNNHYHHE